LKSIIFFKPLTPPLLPKIWGRSVQNSLFVISSYAFQVGAELGSRVCYPIKFLHIRYNMFAGTETLSLRFRVNRNANFALGDRPPILGWELSPVCYPLKILCIGYNLFAGTKTLFLSIYEPFAIQILLGEGRPPIWGKGWRYGVESGTP